MPRSTHKSPRDEVHYAVGIDFGTTKSAISFAIAQSGLSPMPQPVKMYPDFDFLPSCVYIDTVGKQRVLLCGQAAKKRLEQTGNEKAFFKNFKLDLLAEVLDERYHQLGIMPAALAARIIYEVRSAADNPDNGQLNEAGPITSATLTVPAGWSEAQKTKTEEAARAAGIDNVFLLKEPTAALYTLNHERKLIYKPNLNIMVIDYGGGTCDVTICRTETLSLQDREPKIVAEQTLDDGVGGAALDAAIADLFIDWASKKWKVAPKELQPYRGYFERKAEKEKEDFVTWLTRLRTLGLPGPVIKIGGAPLPYPSFEKSLNLADFEAAAQPIVSRMLIPVEESLKAAGLSRGQIHHVFLVGGSSQIPLTQTIAKTYFQAPEKVVLAPNPRWAVCYGAALAQYYNSVETLAPQFQPTRHHTLSIVHRQRPNPLARIINTHATSTKTTRTALVTAGTLLTKAKQAKTLEFRTAEEGQTSLEIRIEETTTLRKTETYVTARLEFGKPVPKGTKIEVSYHINMEDRLVMKARAVDYDISIITVGSHSVDPENVKQIQHQAGINAKSTPIPARRKIL